jgi:lipoprotein-releasing system permease protein
VRQPISAFIGLRYTASPKNSQFVSFLSGVSMLGLIVGVGLLLTVLSVMNGFDRELRQRILSLVPQGAIYHRQGITDWMQLQQRLEAMPGITAAAPFVELHALVSYRGEAVPTVLYGVDLEAEKNVSQLNRYVSDAALEQIADPATKALVLGQGIADKLGVAAGDTVMLIVPDPSSDRSAPRIDYIQIGGILASSTELDHSLALTSLAYASKLTGSPGVASGMRLKLQDLFEAPSVVYRTLMELGPSYYGSNWMQTHGNLYQAIQMSKNLVSLLMSLIVAIAAFNVVSALVMVVVDKQGEIAILRTLGASTGTIMRIFMVQGFTIGVIGTILGILLGLGLSVIIEDAVQWFERLFGIQFLKSDVYPLSYLPADIRIGDVATVAGMAISMSFLATLYPAWRASKLQPADALRYE